MHEDSFSAHTIEMSVPSIPLIEARPFPTSATSILFYWAPPASDGGSPITKYTLACSAISYSQDLSANRDFFEVTGLTVATDYTFTLTATNAIGTSPVATYVTVQPGVTPFGPTLATLSTLNTSTALVTWNLSTIANEGVAKWFVITVLPSTASMSSYGKCSYIYERARTFQVPSTNIYYQFLVQSVNDTDYCRPFAFTSTLGFGITGGGGGGAFSPSSLTGLALWLDGADPLATGTAPANGTSITTWSDKSGVGNNARAGGTTPTFLAASNAISFGGAGYYSTNYTASSSNESLFVVYRVLGANEFQNLVGTAADGGRAFATQNTSNRLLGISRNIASGSVGPNNSIAINSTFIAELIVTSGTQTSFVTGGSEGTSVAVTYTAGRTSLIAAAGDPGSSILTGNIYEILGYSNAFTPFDRQKVEGYLAWKWSLQGNLPASHPFKSAAPTATSVFSPASFSSLQLWIDAADATTVSTSVGTSTIVSLRDKSPNAYRFINTNGYGYVPSSFNTSYPSFTGTGAVGHTLGSNSTFSANDPLNVFFVGKNDKTLGSYSMIYNTPQNTHSLFMNNNNIYSMYAGSQIDSLSIPGTVQSNIIITSIFNGSSSAFIQNGSTITSNFNPGTCNITYGLVLGQWTNTTQPYAWGGKYCELLMYSGSMTTADRQTVEGYLAWKWGLQRSLPTTHPYRYNNPASLDAVPWFATNFNSGNDENLTGYASSNLSTNTVSGTGFSWNVPNNVDVIKTIAVPSTNTVSFCASVFKTSSRSYAGIIYFSLGGGIGGLITSSDGSKVGYQWTGDANTYLYDTGYTIPLNTWRHIVLTISPTQARWYVNGVLTVTRNYTHNPIALTACYIGSDRTLAVGVDRAFPGLIDNIAFYNTTLTPSTISSIYASTLIS